MKNDQNWQMNNLSFASHSGWTLAEEVSRLIDLMQGTLVITPEVIVNLHKKAMYGIRPIGGIYRDSCIKISGSRRKPPPHRLVAELIAQTCEAVNGSINSPFSTAAFLLWRLNWIHPFHDGNGRTARSLAYLILCVGLGRKFPGSPSITELLVRDRAAYLAACEASHTAYRVESIIDVRQLESILAQAVNAWEVRSDCECYHEFT